MAEPLATAPGRIPAPPGGATAAGPVEADAPRRSGAFVTSADRRRYAVASDTCRSSSRVSRPRVYG